MRLATAQFILVSGMLIAACEPATPEARPIPDAEQEILAQERISLDHFTSSNPIGYAHSAAPDITYLNHTGDGERFDGAEAFRAYLATLEVPPHDYEIVDPKVQVYGDVGILSLHYHALGSEGEVTDRWKATSVYRYIDGAWLMVHAHWSPILGETTQ